MRALSTSSIPSPAGRLARSGAALLATLLLAACGGGGGGESGEPAVVFASDAMQPNASFERCILVSEEDDRVLVPRADPLSIGDLVTFKAASDTQWTAFSFFGFHLDLPRGAVIEEATLILYAPAGQQMPASLGRLVADPMQLGTATEISDVGDTAVVLATPPVAFLGSVDAGQPLTANVKAAVQLAVDEGHGQAQFRIHFEGPWDDDRERDLMRLYGTVGAHSEALKPRLQILWRVPQP